ncbi:ribosome-associated translation inhibitor RaiA [Ligilactobacillus sp. Marseille-Q7487]|jgi:putative sigma-54 modulation protein|uniref:ribosome hibernation-promoting factor, HPF/YfiA family n=1 Tax=Ligilactobacillus sp. Marseille-Q7487 TaxID=3022128 RepID=UPI0015B73856|nr:ribosome-associated translation inhibitor RaiA [Ligilactobacillus sp. Marseille-Q7487]
MLKINVRGENIEVTGAIREYVEKKLYKLEKYFTDTSSSTAHVNLKVYTDKNAKVEVTIPLPYLVLRAEETSPDMYASIDLVTDKLERQIRKHKTKLNRKSREKGYKSFDFVAEEIAPVEEKKDDKIEIVRTKSVALKPMDSEEAVLQMEMLGHNFFIYEDAETQGINIVYRRRDGRYGLIEASDED